MLDHADQATTQDLPKINELPPLPVVQTLTLSDYQELRGQNQVSNRIRSLESQINFERIIGGLEPVASKALENLTADTVANLNSDQKAQLLLGLADRQGAASLAAKLLIVESLKLDPVDDRQNVFNQLIESDSLNLLSLIEQSGQATFVASELLNAELRAIITDLPNSVIRQELLKEPDNTLELLKVLKYLDHRSSLKVLWHIHQLSELSPGVAKDLERVWDNALQNSCIHSQINFINCALSINSELAYQRITQTLQTSKNLSELKHVISQVGEHRLLSTGSDTIKETLATANLLSQIQQIKFPEAISSDLSLEDIQTRIESIAGGYQQIIAICKNSANYADTVLASNLIDMAASSIVDLADDVKAILDSVEREQPPIDDIEQWLNSELSQLTGSDALSAQLISSLAERIERDLDHPKSIEQRLTELANTYIKMSELERKFAVDLSYGPSSFLDMLLGQVGTERTVKLWGMDELLAIEHSLSEIGQGHLLFSPNLHHIQKVTSLGYGVLAARYHTGEIRVAEVATTSREIINHYPGIHPLAIVLTHELGHSLQIGSGYTDPTKRVVNGINLGEPRYDFENYLKLSGWTAIDTARWKIIPAQDWFSADLVELDGALYPLGEVIEHEGEKLVLLYYNQLLLSYNPDSEWASRWYAKYSPWEDFAETFAEYILVPHRLAQMAPQKFKFMEEEFRKYANDPAIQKLLKE